MKGTPKLGQMAERGRFDLVAAISAALEVAEAEGRDLIAALLQHALDQALQEDAAIISTPKDE
jgi:hypothetical protein